MQKIALAFSFAGMMIISSCGNKEESKSDPEKNEETTDEQVEEGPKRLTPADIDLNNPVPCDVANAEIMCWEDKIVDVAGYVYTYYGDSASVDYGSLTVLADKESNKHALSVYLKDKEKKFKVNRHDMIHLRGKISGTYFDTVVSMSDAEVIEIKPVIETVAVDPNKEGIVVDAGSLNKDYMKWNNKEIAIIGDYFMTTTSTTSYGTTIRVDLKAKESQYADVGCEFKEDPGDKLKDNREDVIIRGKIKPGGTFGKLQLYDCQVVNR